MDAFPFSRAQSPACSRAQGAVGGVRLRAVLELLLLSLLAVLLGGRRRMARHAATLPLPIEADDSTQDWWIELPESGSIVDLDALAAELPLAIRRLLYLFGARRNRGMRAHPRALPTPCPRHARAPPQQLTRPYIRIRAKSPPGGGRWRASTLRARQQASWHCRCFWSQIDRGVAVFRHRSCAASQRR